MSDSEFLNLVQPAMEMAGCKTNSVRVILGDEIFLECWKHGTLTYFNFTLT